MAKTRKSPKYKKDKEIKDLEKADKPDFSSCRDPEFAEAECRYFKLLLQQCKNNPLLKLLKRKKNV